MLKKLLIAVAALLPLTAAAAEECISVTFGTTPTLTNHNYSPDDTVLGFVSSDGYIGATPKHAYIYTCPEGFKFGNSVYVAPVLTMNVAEDKVVPVTRIELEGPSLSYWTITVNDGSVESLANGVWTPASPVEVKTLTIEPTQAGRTQVLTGFKVYYDGNAQKSFKLNFPSYDVVSAGTDKNLVDAEESPAITWTSSDPSVATVTEAGVLKALAAGKTTITAKWNESEAFLAGEESTVVYVIDGEVQPSHTLDITFKTPDATEGFFTSNGKSLLSSGAESVGEFTECTGLDLTANGLKFGGSSTTGYLAFTTDGAAKVNKMEKIAIEASNYAGWDLYINGQRVFDNPTAATWDGVYTFDQPTVVNNIYISGRYYYIKGISLTYNPNIELDEDQKLDYTTGLADALTVYLAEPATLAPAVGPKVSYTVANPEIAEVNAEGVVSGLKTGSTEIILTWGNGTYKKGTQTIALTVAPARTPEMYFSNIKAEAFEGCAFTAPTLTVIPTTLQPYVRYRTSNSSVATVNRRTGEVKALAVGTAVITAYLDFEDTVEDADPELAKTDLAPVSYTLTVKPYVMANNLRDAQEITGDGVEAISSGIAIKPLQSFKLDGVNVAISLKAEETDFSTNPNFDPAFVQINDGNIQDALRLFLFNGSTASSSTIPVISFQAPEGKKFTKIVLDDLPMVLGFPQIDTKESHNLVKVNKDTGERTETDRATFTNISSGKVSFTESTGLKDLPFQIIWTGTPTDYVSFTFSSSVARNITYTFVNIDFEYEDDVKAGQAFEYDIFPADGSTVSNLQTISVTAKDAGFLAVSGEPILTNGVKTIKLEKATSEIGPDVAFRLTETITEGGKWSFTISNLDYTFDNAKCTNDIRASWDIVFGEMEDPAVAPAAGDILDDTAALNTVTLTFDEGSDLQLLATASAALYTGSDLLTEYAITLNGNVATLTAKMPVTLSTDKEYKLVVAAGSFTNGAAISKEVTATYKFAVNVDELLGAETVTVYSVDGVCLLRAADPAELTTLAPGLYIVNGRKLVITK